jgi:hypothetical protein
MFWSLTITWADLKLLLALSSRKDWNIFHCERKTSLTLERGCGNTPPLSHAHTHTLSSLPLSLPLSARFELSRFLLIFSFSPSLVLECLYFSYENIRCSNDLFSFSFCFDRLSLSLSVSLPRTNTHTHTHTPSHSEYRTRFWCGLARITTLSLPDIK